MLYIYTGDLPESLDVYIYIERENVRYNETIYNDNNNNNTTT